MPAVEDREHTLYVDVSRAASSADALRQLEMALELTQTNLRPGLSVDINTGDLLLTPGVLSKLKTLVKKHQVNVKTLYSSVPQTQQTALDEGLLVRRSPLESIETDEKKENAFVPSLTKQTTEVETPKPKKTSKTKVEEPALEEPKKALKEHGTFSKLSVTHDDGSKQEVPVLKDTDTNTLYYRQTLRSGQVLEASGNIVVIGDAHSGSEILADGDIIVWGFLGGIAHAGRKGDKDAQIRAMRIEAVQLRIADLIARRPDRLFKQVSKSKGPEMAKVQNDEIRIFQDMVDR